MLTLSRSANAHFAGTAYDGSLGTLLRELTLSDLREVARQRGWANGLSDKAELQALIERSVADPTEVARAVLSMPDNLRGALTGAFVADDGNGITPAALARVLSALRGAEVKPVEAAADLRDLQRWGLVFPWHPLGHSQRYLFPTQIQRLVPELPSWCEKLELQPAGQLTVSSPESWLRALEQVVARLAKHPAALREPAGHPEERKLQAFVGDWPFDAEDLRGRLARTGARSSQLSPIWPMPAPESQLKEKSMQAIVEATGVDAEKLEFILSILRELGLTEIVDGRLHVRQRHWQGFQAESPQARHARCEKAYLALASWSEFDMLLRKDSRLLVQRNVNLPYTYERFRSDLLLLRLILLRLLSTAGQRCWCRMDNLHTALRTLWPEFTPLPLSSEANQPAQAFALAWELVWRAGPSVLQGSSAEEWMAAQGSMLRTIVEGPLSWLGMADYVQRGERNVAVRLRGLADLLWQRPNHNAGAQGTALAIHADGLGIGVPVRALSPQGNVFLGSIARVDQTDQACIHYQLDLARAYETFAQRTLDELVADWQRLIAVPMPTAMSEALQRWWDQYGQIHLYEDLALIELKDGITAQELEASTSVGTSMVVRLSPTVFAVPDSAADSLIQELTAKGYMPKELT